jgi:hypothetical protein
VAVRASHGALFNLGLYRRPGKSTADHGRHVRPLVAQVVELKNDWIRLAAVDAGMLTEVLPNAILILSGRPLAVHADLGNLMITIPQVPVLLVFRHACSTPRLPLAVLAVSNTEFLNRFGKSTAPADTLVAHDVRGHVFAEPKERVLAVVNAEFPCCFPGVAVRATHDALGDFKFDRRPGEALRNQVRDILVLVAQVVEVKDNGIGFATINTRVITEVLSNPDATLRGGLILLTPDVVPLRTRDS